MRLHGKQARGKTSREEAGQEHILGPSSNIAYCQKCQTLREACTQISRKYDIGVRMDRHRSAENELLSHKLG